MPCALNRDHELTLVPGTRSRDPLWDDLALFVHAPLKSLLVLVINIDVFAIAKPARPFFPLLLIFPRRAGGAVRVNRKRWLSYHVLLSVGSIVVREFFMGFAVNTL
jgi:hypothetical protein